MPKVKVYNLRREESGEIELADEIFATEVNEALTDEFYAHQVRKDIQEAGEIGVRGVPFFVFNRKYAVSGAQPPEVFLETLKKSFAEWEKDNPKIQLDTVGGPACTPDGYCE